MAEDLDTARLLGDLETVREALARYVDDARPLTRPGREADAEAFERVRAWATEKLAGPMFKKLEHKRDLSVTTQLGIARCYCGLEAPEGAGWPDTHCPRDPSKDHGLT